MTMREFVARYRGVLIALALVIAVGAVLGVLFRVEAGSCDNPLRGIGAAIVLLVLVLISAPLVIGAVLGGVIGWLRRRDAAIVRKALAILSVGILLPGSFVVAATLASARCP